MRRIQTPLFLALMAAAVPTTAQAQVVRGAVTETHDAHPVHGAVIRLIAVDSQRVAMLLTDREGRFVLVAPRQGRYVLEVEHVLYTTTRTPPFTIPPTGTVTANVTLPLRARQEASAPPPAARPHPDP
jgi:hypothetical protein